MAIFSSVIVLGLMGLLFGAILAYASKKFAVEIDERVEAILEVLPGANCGGCGFPGCSGLASAIVEGKAAVNACPVGGVSCATKIGEIMGVSSEAGEKVVAKVICKGNCSVAKDKYIYEGMNDCKAASALNGGAKSCRYGCLGLGTCVSECKFDAIKIIDGVAIIDEDKCVMCGKCIDVCPKGIISKKPSKNEVVIECASKDFGKTVKDNCKVGCIGCGICAKSCPFEAIEMDGKLAKIDYDKCVQCMVCVEKCPTKAIKGNINNRKKVMIEENNCIGCTICKKQCKFDAIQGELKQKHKVDLDKCVGCHACVQKCPKKAIKIL